jgi:hypothetical protein
MNRFHRRADADAPERPITFRVAEDLGAFELVQLWADRTAWPLTDRTAYDELAELATLSALATWLTRWQPIAIHGAVLAGARMEAIVGALGDSLQVAFDRWHEWASRRRDIIVNGKPGITGEEYEAVARRFAAVGIELWADPKGTTGRPGAGRASSWPPCAAAAGHTAVHPPSMTRACPVM